MCVGRNGIRNGLPWEARTYRKPSNPRILDNPMETQVTTTTTTIETTKFLHKNQKPIFLCVTETIQKTQTTVCSPGWEYIFFLQNNFIEWAQSVSKALTIVDTSSCNNNNVCSTFVFLLSGLCENSHFNFTLWVLLKNIFALQPPQENPSWSALKIISFYVPGRNGILNDLSTPAVAPWAPVSRQPSAWIIEWGRT